MRFQVGVLTNPSPFDQWFYEEDEAIEAAREMNAADVNQPIAVWDEDCELLYVFLCERQFEEVP